MINYKGYTGVLQLDEEEGVLRGRVVDTRDIITFQGKTFEEAKAAFRDSVDDYLEFCAELGRPPEKPFSGNISLRIKPEDHRALSVIAQSQGTSVNEVIARQVAKLARQPKGHSSLRPAPLAKSASTAGAASEKSKGKAARTSKEKSAKAKGAKAVSR